MKSSVFCCRSEQVCKVYELPTYKVWRRLYFLDECESCKQSIAVLKEKNLNGNIKLLKRRSGKAAIKLRDDILSKESAWGKPKKGSYSNEFILFNNQGIIYNFNNRRIGINDDFIHNHIS